MLLRRKPRIMPQSLDHKGTHGPISAESELSWTGERLVPSHPGDTAIEHLHRYAFAREYIEGKDVLDIACGEGYGSHLMSNVAASVVGVDISPEVVAHACKKYGDKVTFSVGSCTDIPLDDASVDVVVSFETLEHLAEHELMLKEVKRVLRPGGILILSSPDKLNYTILPKTQNPFHARELSKEEFRILVDKYFSHCYMFEQKICHGSVLAPTAGLAVTGVRHYMGDFHRLAYTDGIMTPPYNIAVATDDGSQLPHTFSLFQGWDLPTELEKNLSDANAAHEQLIDAADSHAAASRELERRLVDAEAAHAAAIGELEKRLIDAGAAHAAALSETEALRRRLGRIRYQAVDGAARLVARIVPRFVLSTARATITRFRELRRHH